MGLGDKLLTDIIAKYFCVSVAKATEDFKKFGEIGLLASHYFLTEKKGFYKIKKKKITELIK